MACWKVAYLVVVVMHLAQPHCLICHQQCHTLPVTYVNNTKISLICEKEEHRTLETFIDSHNFTDIVYLSIKSHYVINLNLTKFHNISELNFSENNLSSLNLSYFYNVKFLNLSHNMFETFVSIDHLRLLSQLDLSYNILKIIPQTFGQSNSITHLDLNNNLICSSANISSNTLVNLNLQNNKIETLKLGQCPNLKTLDLSNNSIQEINKSISYTIPKTEILNLSSNSLKKLGDYSFNLTNLLKLDLRNNKIYSLSQKCFSGLSRLQFLDISMNIIQMVSPSTFQYLNGLINLVVSENKQLRSQDFELLLATRRLKSVYASKTNQKKIPSSLTRSIRYLVLSFNNISQIQCGDLDSYPLLNSLDLYNNNISYIEDDALGRLELLTTINLNENLLSTVPHTLPNNLTRLLLRNNRIKTITNNDFTGLQQLSELDLSCNIIAEIKDGAFSQLYDLQKLNLSRNPLNSLSTNSFSGPHKLKFLDLSYLMSLINCNQTLCFPVPEYNHLQELDMENSTTLVNRFMKDVAALKTFEQLMILNIANSNLTEIRKDLATFLPRLNKLNIQGNNINCSIVKTTFVWFHLQEINKCVFLLSETRPQDLFPLETTTIRYMPTNSNISNQMKPLPTSHLSPTNKSGLGNYVFKENKTELYSGIVGKDLFSNEIWYKNESPGIVDAYSSETPTSHPGLFILLLLPIALVSTCLFLNYSRIKRSQSHIVNTEIDIEISNISSELW